MPKQMKNKTLASEGRMKTRNSKTSAKESTPSVSKVNKPVKVTETEFQNEINPVKCRNSGKSDKSPIKKQSKKAVEVVPAVEKGIGKLKRGNKKLMQRQTDLDPTNSENQVQFNEDDQIMHMEVEPGDTSYFESDEEGEVYDSETEEEDVEDDYEEEHQDTSASECQSNDEDTGRQKKRHKKKKRNKK